MFIAFYGELYSKLIAINIQSRKTALSIVNIRYPKTHIKKTKQECLTLKYKDKYQRLQITQYQYIKNSIFSSYTLLKPNVSAEYCFNKC